jgi:hypothetical protein
MIDQGTEMMSIIGIARGDLQAGDQSVLSIHAGVHLVTQEVFRLFDICSGPIKLDTF